MAGTCTACTPCGPDDYEATPCSSTEDRVCAPCAHLDDCGPQRHRQCGHGVDDGCKACSDCEEGAYRVGCGGLDEGSCRACAGCPFGKVRENCAGHYSGNCVDCGACERGEFRAGCVYMSEGNCSACATCGQNKFLYGCGGMQGGACQQCVECAEGEYEVDACEGSQKRTCTSCKMLPVCDSGKFRAMCGHGNQGACHECSQCPADEYRVGCGYLDGGKCETCPNHCQPNEYLDGCAHLSAGTCRACETCAAGQWRQGCSYTSPGTCVACGECGAESFLTGCSGFEAGSCSACTQCEEGEYEVSPCTATADRVCAACTSLPTCDSGMHRMCASGSKTDCEACAKCDTDGEYRIGCGGLSEGSCEACQGCEAGQVREECGLAASPMSVGHCEDCGPCEDGEFRANCVYLSEGQCRVCQACGDSQWLEGCGGEQPGICKECTICSADEYEAVPCTAHTNRVCHSCSDLPPCGIGHYMSPCGHGVEGQCIACSSCDEGQYLDGCHDSSQGTCATCGSCDVGQYRAHCPGDTGMEPGQCVDCAACEVGYFRTSCGGMAEGECEKCHTCPEGSYRDGCSLLEPGQCVSCGQCGADQYRTGCTGIEEGACAQCEKCPAGQFKTGCGGLEEGSCGTCATCGAKEFTMTPCTDYGDAVCSGCELLPACGTGSFRHGCGGGTEGVCQTCAPCDDGFYRVGCGGQVEGMCVPCQECKGNSTYLQGCGDLTPGKCRDCEDCKDGFYSQGCGGRHAGACISCISFPCPANHERTGCGGNDLGRCIRSWDPHTPKPYDIFWGEKVTSKKCVDDGSEGVPGVVRNFKLPNDYLRLAACNKGEASGTVKLPEDGKWILQFFVGIPDYDKRASEMPAGYPVENESPLPVDESVTLTINGQTREFKNDVFRNEYKKYGDIKVMMVFPSPTSKLDFAWKFKSDSKVDHSHMLVSNAQAIYYGFDGMNEAPALATLLPGEGHLFGQFINAVDGSNLTPGRSMSDGYSGRMRLSDENPVFALLIGTAVYKSIEVTNGKYTDKVKAGEYTCEATLPGFYAYFNPNCAVQEGALVEKDVVMCPFLHPGDTRAILTWGKEPNDLDLWWDMPKSTEWGGKYDGGRKDCRLTWKSRKCWTEDNELMGVLDKDANVGKGPETITLMGAKKGSYILRVENYSQPPLPLLFADRVLTLC